VEVVFPLQTLPCSVGILRVAEIVLDEALCRWWDGGTDDLGFSLHCDRYWLLENLGAAHPAKYANWHWAKLPREIKQLLINFALNGKPLEFLERR